MNKKIKQVFVLGSSRSGTTMMGRILNNHSDICTLRELHFFGTICSEVDESVLSKGKAISLMSKLLHINKYGIFNQDYGLEFQNVSKKILQEKNQLKPIDVYSIFLSYVASINNVHIICEQTPRNVYYLDEILTYFPNAKIINMVRDPRDVLLSQKNKWRRRFLGASKIPFSEALRSYINYHPFLISNFWKSSVLQVINKKDSNVLTVFFEDLLQNPSVKLREICTFIGINYNDEMQAVPNIGSSTELDLSKDIGIDKSKIDKWKNGKISNAEVFICQLINRKLMKSIGYKSKHFIIMPVGVIFYLFSFPFKLILAFFMNLHRMGNILKVFKKRFKIR